MIASVALSMRAKGVDKLFDYLVPGDMMLSVGQRVEVPLGARKVEGYVISLEDRSPSTEAGSFCLKEITRIMDDPALPSLTPDLIGLLTFMRERYVCTWGAAIQAVLPPVTRTKEERRLLLSRECVDGVAADAPEWPPGMYVFLRGRRSVSERVLEDRFGISSAALRQLIALGLLEVEREIVPRVKRRMIRFVRLKSSVYERGAVRGAAQQRVVAYLQTVGEPVRWQTLLSAANASPTVLRALRDKGWIEVLEQEDGDERPWIDIESPLSLTAEQQRALDDICAVVDAGRSETFVLRGVTGSGKTEVYLQAIERVVARGRSAIMLVPEIALTAQMTARFRRRFGERLAVLHSRLSDREKYAEWHRLRSGRADVVIGARSAVFAPLSNIGLIVIDEEHEPSYKQDKDPRYVVREVAAWRGARVGSAIVLGSATPSLETMYRAELGRYRLLLLNERVFNRPLPRVEIVDMRDEMRHGRNLLFSRVLRQALTDVVARKEQAILFLNRRGFSTVMLCRDCGQVAACPSCDISLTLHKGATNVLRCHFCGYSEVMEPVCKGCNSTRVRLFGTGTQRVEHELLDQFPDMRVIRMDVDTTSAKGSHERLIEEFERGEADVLLGTQMIAKGLDFARVSLVGVIAADTSLHVPDFRASERTFQLMVQVAGRAGRHQVPGRMIVQTFAPEHYAIQTAALQDYGRFYQMELDVRKTMEYPPYTEVTVFGVTHPEERIAHEFAVRLHTDLATRLDGLDGVRLLPAVPASIARLRGQFRYQVIVKYKSFLAVRAALRGCHNAMASQCTADLLLYIDVNAQVVH